MMLLRAGRDDAVPRDVIDAGRGDARTARASADCSSANGVAIGSPNASTNRQAMVVARLHGDLLAQDRAHARVRSR